MGASRPDRCGHRVQLNLAPDVLPAYVYDREQSPENTSPVHAVQELLLLHDCIRRFNGEAHDLCVSFSEEHMVGIILHRQGGDIQIRVAGHLRRQGQYLWATTTFLLL
ncbi:hypothetical protein BDW75DRAFT_208230 [Aspergillus navahoensis]